MKRTIQFTILAAGVSAGAANAQTFTDTFNYSLGTSFPAVESDFDVQLGTALGALAPQYSYSNTNLPPFAVFSESVDVDFTSQQAGATVEGKSGTDTSYTFNSELPGSDGPYETTGVGIDFLIGGQAYTGTANFVYNSGANTLTLTTVDYQLAAIAAVPEPASWAMMIGGFGAAGAALRRRRKPVLATA